jgi:hypothetical protein
VKYTLLLNISFLFCKFLGFSHRTVLISQLPYSLHSKFFLNSSRFASWCQLLILLRQLLDTRRYPLPSINYRVFRAQDDWTLTHTSHKDTEQCKIEASITLDGITLTDSLIRWSPNEWPSVCWEIPVSADKIFWMSNKLAQWALYTLFNQYITK